MKAEEEEEAAKAAAAVIARRLVFGISSNYLLYLFTCWVK